MHISQFFAATEMVPVFRLTRDIIALSSVWKSGASPWDDPIEVILYAGTLLYVTKFSNFGDSHSMAVVNPKTLGTLKNKANRWIRVKYDDMEYVEHRAGAN